MTQEKISEFPIDLLLVRMVARVADVTREFEGINWFYNCHHPKDHCNRSCQDNQCNKRLTGFKINWH